MAPIAPGPFEGNLESLSKNQYPEWFTEGKLGIWSHWGPQAVPMEGDWYARLMYEEGQKDYKDHVDRFGHPSKNGWKDIIPLWKAEKWDPERLMALYKKAGAKYFVSMAVHHDNFDLWDSKYQPRWNAVKTGPKRNVVGDWAMAAKKQGLKFGVSEHLGASFTWFQKSRGADKAGPFAGVPYDGTNPAYEDLYHRAAKPGDNDWYTNDPEWHAEWYRRIKDLVDQTKPDLLYTDGPLPFGTFGASIVAHLYNTSIAGHKGKQEAVYACKQTSSGRWAQDVERGVMSKIQEHPWQTDTSIGDWYYNKHWKYRGADWVIHTLVDVISKNGNLLINVVQRPDGSLDPEAEKVLADMADWMAVNSESIYGTKPWVTFGEGPTQTRGGAFKEDFGFTAKDVRYVQKGDGVVYATLMGHPESADVVLTALAKDAGTKAKIDKVELLGSKHPVRWTWTGDGLSLTVPEIKPGDFAVVLKITGSHLRDFTIEPPASHTVHADEDGSYLLEATVAETHGDTIQVESRGVQDNIGYWDSGKEWVSWLIDVAPGKYEVTTTVATAKGQSRFEVAIAGQKLSVTAPETGSWDKFEAVTLGTIEIKERGKIELTVKPADAKTWKPLNLRNVRLRKLL